MVSARQHKQSHPATSPKTQGLCNPEAVRSCRHQACERLQWRVPLLANDRKQVDELVQASLHTHMMTGH